MLSHLVNWGLVPRPSLHESGRRLVKCCHTVGQASILVGCCLATKFLNLNNISRMGGDGSGCGIGLLGVTSNKLVPFPRQNVFGLMLHRLGNVTHYVHWYCPEVKCSTKVGINLSQYTSQHTTHHTLTPYEISFIHATVITCTHTSWLCGGRRRGGACSRVGSGDSVMIFISCEYTKCKDLTLTTEFQRQGDKNK